MNRGPSDCHFSSRRQVTMSNTERRTQQGEVLREMKIGQAIRNCLRDGIAPLCMCLIASLALTAQAADSTVAIELNKLEPKNGACRAYFVLQNRSEIAFKTLKLDLVMFDADGVVNKRLAADLGPLPLGKTSLKVFDMDDLSCTELGRLLLNDVTACADDSGSRDDCLTVLSASTRTAVSFIK